MVAVAHPPEGNQATTAGTLSKTLNFLMTDRQTDITYSSGFKTFFYFIYFFNKSGVPKFLNSKAITCLNPHNATSVHGRKPRKDNVVVRTFISPLPITGILRALIYMLKKVHCACNGAKNKIK